MIADIAAPVIDRAQLTRVARVASNRPALEVVDWSEEPLQGGIMPTTGRLSRVAGTGRDGGETVAWSVILKVVRDVGVWTAGGADPARVWGYWRREPLAYSSGLFDGLPDGLAAPRCYEASEGPDGSWLWLEEVVDEHGPRWPLARYGLAARHLGAFNGAFLAGRPIPDLPWLSAGGLRAWCARFLPNTALLATIHERPSLRHYWPGDLAERTLRLADECDAWLDALDQLPQTLGHCDATRPNLFVRRRHDGRDETVAIDWAFLGRAAIGQEVAQLVNGSALFFRVDLADLADLEGLALEGYLAGLRDAGWRGDERLARLGYLIDTALRHSFLHHGLVEPDDAFRARVARATGGRTYEEHAERVAELRHFLLDRADQARALLMAMA